MELFTNMSQEYAQKHFPDGFVFDAETKTLKKMSAAHARRTGLYFILYLCLLVMLFFRIPALSDYDRDDTLIMAIVFFVICILLTVYLLKRTISLLRMAWKKPVDYVAVSAKVSRLTENEIAEFNHQAFASDCVILKLAEIPDQPLPDTTDCGGLLTRDYIYLTDTPLVILRVDSLLACCFVLCTRNVSEGKRRKSVHNYAICLLASNGVSACSNTTAKAGYALMKLLRERRPSLDTNDGKVLAANKLKDYRKRILAAQRVFSAGRD